MCQLFSSSTTYYNVCDNGHVHCIYVRYNDANLAPSIGSKKKNNTMDNDDSGSLRRKTVQLSSAARMKTSPMSLDEIPPPPRPEHVAMRKKVVATQTASSSYALSFLAIVALCVCVSSVTFAAHESIVKVLGVASVQAMKPTWKRHEMPLVNTSSVHATQQTTSVTELLQVRRELLTTLTAEPMLQLLCMHHLQQHPSNMTRVRLCALYNEDASQYYFMQNLRLTGYNKSPENVVAIRETSIACENAVTRNRASLVYAEWEDERHHTHYMALRGPVAHKIQLYVEEFAGNKHCV